MTGHLFQGRYKAILIQKEAHLLELSRYIILNSVWADRVSRPKEWHWSSYATCFDGRTFPERRDTDWLLRQFGSQRRRAQRGYREFVMAGRGLPSPLLATKHQLILGDDVFVERYRQRKTNEELRELSRAHRRSLALPLAEYAEKYLDRNQSMCHAYRSDAYTMAQIAEYFDVHYMTVSRVVRDCESTEGVL